MRTSPQSDAPPAIKQTTSALLAVYKHNMSPSDLPAPTPSSERSVYFDAPLMHFFTQKDKTSRTPVHATDANPVHQDTEPQPSVTIDSGPVVTRYHENLNEDEEQQEDRKPMGTKLSVGTSTDKRASSPPSDSGYGSSSPTTVTRLPERSASRASRSSLKPVPVVWKDGQPNAAADRPDMDDDDSGGDHRARRAASMRSFRSSASRRDREDYDHESIRSTPASRYSERRRRVSLSGGSFAGGAGTIGPGANPRPDETQSFSVRARSAEASLTPKQRSKVEKSPGMSLTHINMG